MNNTTPQPSSIDTLLIDADTLVYSCGFACEKKKYTLVDYGTRSSEVGWGKLGKAELLETIPKEDKDTGRFELIEEEHVAPTRHALQMVKTSVLAVQDNLMVDQVIMYLSGPTNFRNELSTITTYKGNREGARQPAHKDEIKEYIKGNFSTVVTVDIEADDAMGLDQREEDTCIVSIDKDMLTVPGWHYNWKERTLKFVTPWQAMVYFYSQLLTGDSVDNIPGIKGIGPAKAAKILKDCKTEEDLWNRVKEAYAKLSNYTYEQMLEIGQLLWIQRTGRVEWTPPNQEV